MIFRTDFRCVQISKDPKIITSPKSVRKTENHCQNQEFSSKISQKLQNQLEISHHSKTNGMP